MSLPINITFYYDSSIGERNSSIFTIVPCSVYGINGHVWTIWDCWFIQFRDFLETIELGWICMALSILIILISIFGRINDSYKWFILNAAIWDLLLSYNFMCSQPVLAYSYFARQLNIIKPNTCIWYNPKIPLIPQSFEQAINNGFYGSLFLLALSRYLAVCRRSYYSAIEKSPFKLFCLIFGVDFISIFGATIGNILVNGKIVRNVSPIIFSILFLLKPLTAGILLIGSTALTLAVLIKVMSLFKFQAQQNSQNLKSSIRIAIVLLFQCFLASILFCFGFSVDFTTALRVVLNKYFDIYFELPSAILNLDSTLLKPLRSFIEMIIVLTVFKGYRNPWKRFVLAIFGAIQHPFEYSKKLFSSNTITPVIAFKSYSGKPTTAF